MMSTGNGNAARTAYSSTYADEEARLALQAKNTAESDRMALDFLREQGGMREHMTVLDVGCAYGHVTRDRFASLDCVDRIIGVDANAKAIERARALHADVPKMSFEVVDLEDDGMEERLRGILSRCGAGDGADIVYSSLTLHHLSDPVRVLRVLRRLLAPGGHVIIRGSDDGSKMCYPGVALMEWIIDKSMSVRGASDRMNGRKLFMQLIEAGYGNVRILSNMRDTSALDEGDRDVLFKESFAYRIDYFEKECERNPSDVRLLNECEDMRTALQQLERRFHEKGFWYCEYDYVAVAEG